MSVGSDAYLWTWPSKRSSSDDGLIQASLGYIHQMEGTNGKARDTWSRQSRCSIYMRQGSKNRFILPAHSSFDKNSLQLHINACFWVWDAAFLSGHASEWSCSCHGAMCPVAPRMLVKGGGQPYPRLQAMRLCTDP